MKIDQKFKEDAHKTLDTVLRTGSLAEANGKPYWFWLEQDKVRLNVYDYYVEFQTANETLKINLIDFKKNMIRSEIGETA